MANLKLNQVIAILQGAKQEADRRRTDAYKKIQKASSFSGLIRTYRPLVEGTEQFPEERTDVQQTVLGPRGLISDFRAAETRKLDVMFTQESGNTTASADVKIDEQVILENVPATFLLALERELKDVRTFIEKLPVTDSAETWLTDEATGLYVTRQASFGKTKKIPRVLVKYEATPHHPAQVDTWMEDVLTGYWDQLKFSGAILPILRDVYLERLQVLLDAVRQAREAANNLEVEDRHAGQAVFSYLFGSASSA